ncbi:MAG: CPBP family intramembrane metalloprotease [Actinomycetota bacterium]|nr:CPBP family intramembrane metalloprotease [Actinomycetota bacterium]
MSASESEPLRVEHASAHGGSGNARPAGPTPIAVLAGLALLLVRPELVDLVRSPIPALAALYGIVLVVSLLPRQPADLAPPLGPARSLALGAAAVVLAWLAVRTPAVPVRAGSAALFLDTLAAVAEEALFRRLLYGWLSRWGAVVAVAGSAVAFALIHVPTYGVAALPVDLGAGLVLSWQRWAGGRWEVPAATHALANLLVVVG